MENPIDRAINALNLGVERLSMNECEHEEKEYIETLQSAAKFLKRYKNKEPQKLAILTDGEGNILGTIGYRKNAELIEKTISIAESVNNDTIKSYGKIQLNKAFEFEFEFERTQEFYLTPTKII